MRYCMPMAKTPITALVMHPVVLEDLLRPHHLERLHQVCQIVSPTPARNLTELAEHNRLEVLITSWGCPRVDSEAIANFPRLGLIAHLGGSVKGFLDPHIWRRNIKVVNAVAANAVPVAEFTLAAIIFANKQVFHLNRFYLTHQENRAPWSREAPGVGNYGKVVGIVGASHVGQALMQMLKGFDFKVLLYDPYTSPLQSREMGASKVGLAELLSQADVVSLHAPLLSETKEMIGARELLLMKDGATIINTARGGLIDQASLIEQLQSGRIKAVLDTTSPEVLPPDSPLYRLPNVFLTPHIAGSLGDETQRLADQIVKEVERFCQGSLLRHLVRKDELPRLA